ncbi:MAG: hypothetical protein KKG59_04120 [Nanoarchaeota archaeon]|nr:hypothetical protein [Nanoarchaeota archaeon]
MRINRGCIWIGLISLIVFLLTSCSEPEIQALAVKEIPSGENIADNEEIGAGNELQKAPEQEVQSQQTEQPPQVRTKIYDDVVSGEELHFYSHKIHIIDILENRVKIKIDDTTLEIKQGESITHNSIRIALNDIKTHQRESLGLVKFYFQFGKKWKDMQFSEKDSKMFKDGNDRYVISLEFVGQKSGKEVAVFMVNNQRTDTIEEKDSFYFKDGSYIYVQDIMHGIKPRTVTTTYLTIEISEVQ